MRVRKLLLAFGLLVTGAFAGEALQVCDVACATNVWQVSRTVLAADDRSLTLRNEGSANGFAILRQDKQRRSVSIEASVTLRQRLGKDGWNFAGVTLYQDDANYWMLALVEGPEGKHSVDFIECHAGIWQAQNEAKTALKRVGNVTFDWKTGVAYRLQLALVDGKVTAQVADSAEDRIRGEASFELGHTPAVRSARPGLIVHASVAACTGVKIGKREVSNGDRGLPAVALLDDDLPGQDRAATARLAAALGKKGFGVTSITAEQLIAPEAVTAERYPILVLPQCASLPARAGAAVAQFEREGGHLIFIGGPFLDRALWKVGGTWLDAAGRAELLERVEPAHRPFIIGPEMNVGAWMRSSSDKADQTEFRVVNEGPQNKPCLRLTIASLQGWEVRHSPVSPRLFGEGDDFLTFMAKGSDKATQIAVEVSEKDGSRWIATVELTSEWRRVGLPLEAFRFWPDSAAKRRGETGGRLDPSQALRVGFGMSSSHTPAMVGGGHTVWLADVGTARDPLAAAGVAQADLGDSIECVYPRYKVYTMTGPSEVRVAEGGSRGSASVSTVDKRALSMGCQGAVCAITRPLGEGFGRGGKWRFLPLAEATERATKAVGACEWLLLNTQVPLDGTVIAGFGYSDPAVWASPEVAARIADAAERMAQGVAFEEAGTERFAYWPGEPVKLGARVRAFAGTRSEIEIALDVLDGTRVVWRERVRRPLESGVAELAFVWQPPATPGTYAFRARLEGDGRVDEVRHDFVVLDPAPAPKSAFITARNGDFWLDGKKWYPVGMNYWPLYVSGMDQADYWPGWLKDAYYSPTLVERDLAQMRDMGINMVSIQTPPREGIRNLLDFLRLCKKYDIYANVYVGLASPLTFNDAELKAYLGEARLPGNATVFAYDTIWEPGNHVFKDDAARAKWDGEWRAWIDERYGSIERAEKDWGFKARRGKDGKVISPPDNHFREDGAWRVQMAAYRRFMDNLTSRLWGKANRRLRELDPNHLVSFRQGNTLPHDFALSGPVKHIDFICPEGYAIRDTDEGENAIGFITRYVDFTTHGKPIVWSEFGVSAWDGVRMEPSPAAIVKQGSYSERFYRTGLAAGANGTVPWWWVGGYRVDERSDFGIVGPDRSERPSARLIRDYGPRFKTPRDKPRPEVWFEFDRDAHAGGYCRAAFHEGAAAYRAAVKDGKVLGVRTAGTGTDQMTGANVAVGNVPCDGTNPPKYLDAEFNSLQVLNADGIWQEADDGAVITVATNRPVRARASVGNTQEATWRGDCEQAVVTLAVSAKDNGARLGQRFLPHDGRRRVSVPYLGDADFGEFDLFWMRGETRQPALPVTVSVRMEMVQRGPHIPFGEARVFTVKAKGL